MTMFRAAMAAALVFLGAISAFLGAVVVASALGSGSLQLSHVAAGAVTNEVILRLSDPGRFWRMLTLVGFMPLGLGTASALWGWRMLKMR